MCERILALTRSLRNVCAQELTRNNAAPQPRSQALTPSERTITIPVRLIAISKFSAPIIAFLAF